MYSFGWTCGSTGRSLAPKGCTKGASSGTAMFCLSLRPGLNEAFSRGVQGGESLSLRWHGRYHTILPSVLRESRPVGAELHGIGSVFQLRQDCLGFTSQRARAGGGRDSAPGKCRRSNRGRGRGDGIGTPVGTEHYAVEIAVGALRDGGADCLARYLAGKPDGRVATLESLRQEPATLKTTRVRIKACKRADIGA